MVAAAGMLSGTATVLIWHNLVKPNERMLYEFDHYMDDPLPGTLPSGTVLVDEPMEDMEAEVRSGK